MYSTLTLAALSILLFLPSLQAADAPSDDVWAPFQFLLGDWVGSGSGKPGQGAGEFSLKFDLGRKILVRRNQNQLTGKPGESTGATHEDLMIIYPEPGNSGFRADYFDNEGHVIRYTVSCADYKATFQSNDAANGPKFRLTYDKKPDGSLAIDFAVAAPGKPFQTYVSGAAKRK